MKNKIPKTFKNIKKKTISINPKEKLLARDFSFAFSLESLLNLCRHRQA